MDSDRRFDEAVHYSKRKNKLSNLGSVSDRLAGWKTKIRSQKTHPRQYTHREFEKNRLPLEFEPHLEHRRYLQPEQAEIALLLLHSRINPSVR
jgi:hypothetical protein